MVDQLSTEETCRICGSPLSENRESTDLLCGNCSTLQTDATTPGDLEKMDDALNQSLGNLDDEYVGVREQPGTTLDPDHPLWGPVAGIGIWMLSRASTIAVPVAALFAWYILNKQRGLPVPVITDATALLEYVQSPRILLVQVYSTIIAHVIMLAFCWMVG